MSIGYTLNELARMAVEGEIKGNPQFVQVGESSPQQTEKIEELSDRNRTLVDKVSILERENRSLREKYRDALEALVEAEHDIRALQELLDQKDEELYAYGKLDPRTVPEEAEEGERDDIETGAGGA